MGEHVRERSTGLVHGGTMDGNDYTLCGTAMEGENGDDNMVVTNRRISCGQCIALILHCKSIPMSKLNRDNITRDK